MVAKTTHRNAVQASTAKPKARNIGKAFVRPGALARYVDAQKISNFSLLKVLGKRGTAPSTGAQEKVLEKNENKRSSRLMKCAPNVDITRKSKSGKRVRNYLTDKHLKFQYATVPTPRGIGPSGSQALPVSGKGKQQPKKKRKSSAKGNLSPRLTTKTQRTPMSPKLVSLPNDILTRVLCCMQHQEIPPLMNVCRGLADVAKIAITTHFNFLTPDPKRVSYHQGQGHHGKKQNKPQNRRGGARGGEADASASISMGNNSSHPQRVFGSASQPTPMAPRQKRRSRRFSNAKRRKGSKIKKRSLVFDETETTTTNSTSGSSGSDTGKASF
jgi:hypothetical protein